MSHDSIVGVMGSIRNARTPSGVDYSDIYAIPEIPLSDAANPATVINAQKLSRRQQ